MTPVCGAREHRPGEGALDEIYLKYAHTNPFLPVIHFVDHVTMGSEALVGLGMGIQVKRWASGHTVRPYQPPSTGISIESDWRQALGRQDSHGDWLRHFELELNVSPFPDVLRRWVPRFAHAVGALLFHGLIRTAHATRALAQRDTAARRGELARGLSLWAIAIQTPPAEAGSDDDAQPDHLHFARLGAATFIQAPSVPNLHLVTGAMAYGLVAPYLDAATHRRAARSFAKTHARAREGFEVAMQSVRAAAVPSLTQSQRMALVAQRDAHPIKLTEAALRAYEQTQDEIFLKAAGKALEIHGLRALFVAAKAVLGRRHALVTG